MWQTIDKETYMEKVKGLKPIESFTDPDGTMEFSCGKPQIETIWGTVATVVNEDGEYGNQPVVKCEMRKHDRHQKDWDTEYFEYVNPVVKGDVLNTMITDPSVKNEEVKSPATETEQEQVPTQGEATQEEE